MTNKEEQLYDVWWQHTEGEQQMEERHLRGWREVIGLMKEEDLTSCSVLDFGCNQGGFLRHLYQQKPFKDGIGIDLAQKSVETANARKGDLPLQYVATGSPEQLETRFDLAFSLSVLYLIDDLKTHAWKLKQALKPGGVYYATFTDYRNNPSVHYFQEQIAKNSLLKAQLHTLDDIAAAFFAEGFQVGIRRRIPADFVALASKEKFFLSIDDKMQEQYEQAYIFRFSLPADLG